MNTVVPDDTDDLALQSAWHRSDPQRTRRRLLRSASGVAAGLLLAPAASGVTLGQEVDTVVQTGPGSPPSIGFENQTTAGSELVVDHVETDAPGVVGLYHEVLGTLVPPELYVRPGEPVEDRVVELDPQLEQSRIVTLNVDQGDGSWIVEERALVTVEGDEPAAELLVSDQGGDGTEVTIDLVGAQVDASVAVLNEAGDVIGRSAGALEAGDVRSDVAVSLDERIRVPTEVEVVLEDSVGERLASESVTVTPDGYPATMAVTNQTSDGSQVVVDSFQTRVGATLAVTAADGTALTSSDPTFEAGDSATDLVVDLDDPLDESRVVDVTVRNDEQGTLASETVLVTVEGDEPGASLTVPHQPIDWDGSVRIVVATQVAASVVVTDRGGNRIADATEEVEAGTVEKDYPLFLGDGLEESQWVTVSLHDADGDRIASEDAFVEVEGGRPLATLSVDSQTTDGSTIVVDAIQTAVDARLVVGEGASLRSGGVELEAGERREDVVLELEPTLSGTRTVDLELRARSVRIARSVVTVSTDRSQDCPAFGDVHACDTNDDGLHRDFDGDGEVTTADVSEFQANLFSDGVQGNATSFDFSGSEDGSVSHGDVVALFVGATGL